MFIVITKEDSRYHPSRLYVAYHYLKIMHIHIQSPSLRYSFFFSLPTHLMYVFLSILEVREKRNHVILATLNILYHFLVFPNTERDR